MILKCTVIAHLLIKSLKMLDQTGMVIYGLGGIEIEIFLEYKN